MSQRGYTGGVEFQCVFDVKTSSAIWELDGKSPGSEALCHIENNFATIIKITLLH